MILLARSSTIVSRHFPVPSLASLASQHSKFSTRCLESANFAARPNRASYSKIPTVRDSFSLIFNSNIHSRDFSAPATETAAKNEEAKVIEILGKKYQTDEWTNVSSSILTKLDKKLLKIPTHPANILKELAFSQFPSFAHYDSLPPVVTTWENFDSLLIAPDHPGRAKTDTYYINKDNLLRTHTSSHQVQLLKAGAENNKKYLNLNQNSQISASTSNTSTNINKRFLVAADVFRRDEIDSSHYPAFHQMEGVCTFDRKNLKQEIEENTRVSIKAQGDLMKTRNLKPNLSVETHDDTEITDRNPVQADHTEEEVLMLTKNMKETMNSLVSFILSQATDANSIALEPAFETHSTSLNTDGPPPTSNNKNGQKILPVRWIEAQFPFTSPSWEMEVWWNGKWLEICGCGIMKQQLLNDSGLSSSIGWAFGFGIDRLAMILFGVPDIRLFWSDDPRFINQFSPGQISKFIPFSKFSPCHKDISFWAPSSSNESAKPFHENDLADLVREIAGDLVEDVKLVDTFTHPKTNRTSMCYRINYCSMDRNVTNEEINILQERLRTEIVNKLGVELR